MKCINYFVIAVVKYYDPDSRSKNIILTYNSRGAAFNIEWKSCLQEHKAICGVWGWRWHFIYTHKAETSKQQVLPIYVSLKFLFCWCISFSKNHILKALIFPKLFQHLRSRYSKTQAYAINYTLQPRHE